MMNLSNISKILSTYNGRDKVIRTVAYSTKLAAALVPSESMVVKLETLSTQLSACRTVLRLFDDIPMLNYTLAYGLGKEEQDRCMKILGVLTNAVDQLYYPLEHIAWAADHKLVSLRSNPWWTASTACWAMSLYLTLIKTMRCFAILQYHKSCLRGVDVDVNVAMSRILAQQRHELLTAFRCIGDLAQAVHWLPDGILWAGKLEKWQVALLGTVTSLIGLYQACERMTKQNGN